MPASDSEGSICEGFSSTFGSSDESDDEELEFDGFGSDFVDSLSSSAVSKSSPQVKILPWLQNSATQSLPKRPLRPPSSFVSSKERSTMASNTSVPLDGCDISGRNHASSTKTSETLQHASARASSVILPASQTANTVSVPSQTPPVETPETKPVSKFKQAMSQAATKVMAQSAWRDNLHRQEALFEQRMASEWGANTGAAYVVFKKKTPSDWTDHTVEQGWEEVASYVERALQAIKDPSLAPDLSAATEKEHKLRVNIILGNAACKLRNKPKIMSMMYTRLHPVAVGLSNEFCKGLHMHAIEKGFSRELVKPYQSSSLGDGAKADQRKHIPYMSPDISKKHDASAVQLAFLLHSAMIDEFLHTSLKGGVVGKAIQAKSYGEFKDAPLKNLARIKIKAEGDYRKSPEPQVGSVLDSVRRMLISDSLEQQETFIGKLEEHDIGGPAGKVFDLVRVKNTMPSGDNNEVKMKQVLINVVFKPIHFNRDLRSNTLLPGHAWTFRDLSSTAEGRTISSGVREYVKKLNKGISDMHLENAYRVLLEKSIQDKPISMVIEMQLYLRYFEQFKAKAHVWLALFCLIARLEVFFFHPSLSCH